jgi:hypothetical protein
VELLEDRLAPATMFVHNFGDGPSTAFAGAVAPNLRSAVEHSRAGDTIALDNGTYRLTAANGGDLRVDHNLTIANTQGGLSTIDAQAQSRVFTLTGPSAGRLTVALTRLKITHGDGNGSGQGGGLLLNTNVVLTLDDDVVTGNAVSGTPALGGGIASINSTLVVTNSIISDNHATGSVEQGAGALAQGAGIYASGGRVMLTGSTVAGNVALGGENAGAFAQADGGGLFLTGPATAVVTATTVAGNVALGTADATGAGPAAGGGLYQDAGTTVFITGSTFSGNQAVGGSSVAGGGNAGGGGLFQFFDAGNLSIVNSTFAGNAARGGAGSPGFTPGGVADAGGLSLSGGGTDRLVNDTIAFNVAASGGPGGSAEAGGLLVAPPGVPRPQLWNTLVAENVAPVRPDVDGAFVTLGHNLIGNAAGSTGFSPARGDLLNIPALQIGLLPLATNGGPTLTLALAPTSLALDHGDDAVLTDPVTALSTDQRGQPCRAGAHVDIGAFEAQPPGPPRPHGRGNGVSSGREL